MAEEPVFVPTADTKRYALSLREFFLSAKGHTPFVVFLFHLYFCFICFIWFMAWTTIRPPNAAASTQSRSYSSRPVSFIDDGTRGTLLQALQRQQDYFRRQPASRSYTYAGTNYTSQQIEQGLAHFKDLLTANMTEEALRTRLLDAFTLVQAQGRHHGKPGEILLTAYYEPLVEGRLHRSEAFPYPLYSLPDNQQLRTLSRSQIEGTTRLAGHELIFLPSLWDAFVLHVQGSGKIILQDKSIHSLQYAGNNGYTYTSIGKVLVNTGKMRRQDVSMQTIHAYLLAHPDEEHQLLSRNKRFIYFKWAKKTQENPSGSLHQELTAGRSIAIDGKALPFAGIGYLISRIPIISATGTITGWKTLRRFVLPQDSGAAIKGSGRADLFVGHGVAAEATAGILQEQGELFFLLPRSTTHTLSHTSSAKEKP